MRKCSLRLCAALALSGGLLLTGTSLASAASPVNINMTLPAVTKTTYSISGTVYNAAGSAGMGSVFVDARSSGSGSGTSGSATSSASGAYTIAGLLPGAYTLSFDPPRAANLQYGYRSGTGPGYFTMNQAAAAAQTITTANLTARNVRLPAGFKISGKVTQVDGVTPVSRISVKTAGYEDSTVTDSLGNFVLMGLSPGSYVVDFDPGYTGLNYMSGSYYTGNANKFSTALHSTLAISTASVSGINSRIPAGLKVTGYVKTRAATPLPIAGAMINANGPSWVSADTDATGRFELVGLNPGAYSFSVYADGYQRGSYVTTGPNYWSNTGASTVNVAAAVTLATIKPAAEVATSTTGYHISGRVTTTSGVPLSGFAVAADSTGDYANTQTDGFGYYSVGPLAAGSYTLSFGSSWGSYADLQTGYYKNVSPTYFTPVESSATAIPVSANVTGKNVQIPRGLTLSGVITITGGQACVHCNVYAVLSGGYSGPSAQTDSTGAYKLIGLAPGRYTVEASGSDAWTTGKLRITSDGYYKSGATGNYTSSSSSATLVAVS